MKILNKIKCWWYGCDWELCGQIYEFRGQLFEKFGIESGLTIRGKDWYYCKRCNRKL